MSDKQQNSEISPQISNANNPINDTKKLDIAAVFGIIGNALFWTWFLLTWFSPLINDFSPFKDSAQQIEIAFRICGIGGTAIGFFILLLFAPKIMTLPGKTYMTVMAVAGAIPLYALMYLQSEQLWDTRSLPIIWVLAWLFTGIASACLMMRAGLFLSTVSGKEAGVYLAISQAIGALNFLLMSHLMDFTAIIVLFCLPALVSILFTIQKNLYPIEKSFDLVLSVKRWHFESWQSVPQQILFGVCFGLALGFGIVSIYSNVNYQFIITVIIFLAVIMLIINLISPQRSTKLSEMRWFTIPLVAVGATLLVLNIPLLTAIGSILLIVGFFHEDQTHLLMISEINREHRQSGIAIICAGRLLSAIGVCMGWLSSYMLLLAGGITNRFVVVGSVLFVIVLIITLAILGNPNNRNNEVTVTKNAGGEGRYRLACESICEEAELSPRQREVFVFLAKGRNSRYIGDALFISDHTVKAHTYRIYQKLDLHSQQDLIDLVDARQRELALGTTNPR